MEILTNDLKFSESNLKVFSSVLGKMVQRYFDNPENKIAYEKQKPQLTLEIQQLEKRRKELKGGKYGENQGKKDWARSYSTRVG